MFCSTNCQKFKNTQFAIMEILIFEKLGPANVWHIVAWLMNHSNSTLCWVYLQPFSVQDTRYCVIFSYMNVRGMKSRMMIRGNLNEKLTRLQKCCLFSDPQSLIWLRNSTLELRVLLGIPLVLSECIKMILGMMINKVFLLTVCSVHK